MSLDEPNGAAAHRLKPLLRPDSIAFVGASVKPDTTGNRMLTVALSGGYGGRMYPVNPGYAAIEGLPCYASVKDLPSPPDLAVLAVADQRLETALVEVIETGARAALIFGGANLEGDTDRKLAKRLKAIGIEAGLPICGGNCMGFYNLDHHLLATFSNPPYPTRAGGITLLSHSGSSWAALNLNDGRMGYNLSVSTGQELTVTLADYIDYAAQLPTTKAIGLLIETVRDPESFLTALEKATRADLPIVALKVGRSEQSAALAISHSGAIAGDDAAYEAVFHRHGVVRVHDLEQLGACLMMFTQPYQAAPGGVAAVLDSGFERELFIDRAHALDVPLTGVSDTTRMRLERTLDPGLEPVNPVDAWGTGKEFAQVFSDCLDILLTDPEAALGLVSHNARDDAWVTDGWLSACLNARAKHSKPVALVSSFPWLRSPKLTKMLTEAGVAVINGMDNGLIAARAGMQRRDFKLRPPMQTPPAVAPAVRARWAKRLCEADVLGEAEGLALLRDYGIGTVTATEAASEREALDIASQWLGPVAMKTATAGIHHKSDVDGVRLNLAGPAAVTRAYADLSERLGPRVCMSAMAPAGVEMTLGLVCDAQFGALVVIGAGGLLIELLGDRRLALPPFDAHYATTLINELRSAKLLNGFRGTLPSDVLAYAQAAARLSLLAVDLGEHLAELDINPIMVIPSGAIAVDALIVPRAHAMPTGKPTAMNASEIHHAH